MTDQKLPVPPPGPPTRSFKDGLFGFRETKESKARLVEYKAYMRGWKDGFDSASNKR
jgi:hypothetical protein